MDLLTPVLFTDDWGSRVSIASLQGRQIPTREPESELWMGAHESGPATVLRDGRVTTLDRVIRADPLRELGARCVAEHGIRLPFLLKVLAPGRAISIQVHPSAAQARAERARSGDAVYVDDSAKPELLLALAPFEIFIGMRPYPELVDLAAELRVPRLAGIVAAAERAERPEHSVLAGVLATEPAHVRDFAREVVAACVRMESSSGQYARAAAGIAAIAEDHADDIGLVVLALMGHRVLQPGEFVDVAAGVLHSYARGLGIEVLANSDNVVRAGLTRKEVNVPELLRIVDPRATVTIGSGIEVAPGVLEYPSDSGRFRLRRVTPGSELPASGGPRLVFCLRGEVTLDAVSSAAAPREPDGHVTVNREVVAAPGPRPEEGSGVVRLGRVEAAFLGDGVGRVRLSGDGEVYLVDLP